MLCADISFDEIKSKITPFLKAVGFNPKTDLTFIPVSAQKGENMKDVVDKKIAPWYEGPSLLQFLDNIEVLDRDVNAPFMLPISEKYNELGTMVMGKIESGRVRKGDTLLLMPNRASVEVAAIYTETAEEMDVAFCGDNIRIRLRGITDDDVQPGYVLTSPSKPVKAVTAFKADLSIIETQNIICSGFTCVLHVHTLTEEVTLTVSPTSTRAQQVCEVPREPSSGGGRCYEGRSWWPAHHLLIWPPSFHVVHPRPDTVAKPRRFSTTTTRRRDASRRSRPSSRRSACSSRP